MRLSSEIKYANISSDIFIKILVSSSEFFYLNYHQFCVFLIFIYLQDIPNESCTYNNEYDISSKTKR